MKTPIFIHKEKISNEAVKEVINYFIWRQQDATRNSISSVAQSLYSGKELEGKTSDTMQEMIFQKGINWNDFDFRKKRGAVIARVEVTMNNIELNQIYTRNKWQVVETHIFTQDKGFIKSFLPISVIKFFSFSNATLSFSISLLNHSSSFSICVDNFFSIT
jgi:hypothetical protein